MSSRPKSTPVSPGQPADRRSYRFATATWIAVLGVMILTPVASRAQVTAAISGKVEDVSGGAMDNATITVKSLETGRTRVVTTDESGSYRVSSLPLGATEVRAEKTGFKATVRTGIDLVVGQDATVDLRLEVGNKVEEINVVEGIPTVNITTSPVSGLVTEEQVKDLPLNGRSLDVLITTNPGAINYSALKSPANHHERWKYLFSGRIAGPATTSFFLNGVEWSGSKPARRDSGRRQWRAAWN